MRLKSSVFVRLALLLPLATSVPLSAQIAIYGMGSGAFLGSSNGNASFSSYGFTLGAYDDVVRLGPFKLGGDVRYLQASSSKNSSYDNKIRGGLIGPRLSLAIPHIPFHPYIQAEGGDIATNYGTLTNLPNSLAYQIQGGLDFTVFPHFDVRAEYGGGQIGAYGSGGRQSLQEAGLGLVVRF